MTRVEVLKLVAGIAAAYPNANVTRETAEVYAAQLADLELGIAQKAVRQILNSSKFFPTISEIREVATELTPAKERKDHLTRKRIQQVAEDQRRSQEPRLPASEISALVSSVGRKVPSNG